jgi:peptidylprolyl isomerase
MRICSAILALAFAVISIGCGGSGDASTSAKGESMGSTTGAATSQKARYPVPQAAPGKRPLRKLVVKDLEVGKGPVANWGDEATVRYVGVYYDSGKIYSQHWNFSWEFELDGKTPGPGWQKGIHGMRVGGRRELLIPSDLLFGDGDLAYIVTLVRTKEPARSSFPQEGPFEAIEWKRGDETPHFDPADRPAPTKLLFRNLEEGSGPAAEPGDEVKIFYAGFVYETGERRYGGSAGPFRLGSGGLGAAFERGLVGMKAGSRRELIVPSRFLGGTPAIDYGIVLESLSPAAEP